jgi:hypothetical protein
MDCRTARLLVPFARAGRGELDPGEQHALQRHLADCANCRREWTAQRRLDAVFVRAMRAVALPQGFKERLLARLQCERRRTHQRWLTSAAAALAAALFIGSFAYYCWRTPEETVVLEPPPSEEPGQLHFPHEVIEHFEKLGYSIELPRDLVNDWDFRLAFWLDVSIYNGQYVPTLYFKKGRAVAKVQILKRGQFDAAALGILREANDPHRKILGNPESDEYIAVVVLHGQAKVEDFHRPPERVA